MKDRAGDEMPEEPPPPPRGRCDRCHHGWVEEFYDAAGRLLGNDYLTAAEAGTIARDGVVPCPRCSPEQHLRWASGCWRSNDEEHDPASCPTCVEDGRHLLRARP